MKDPVQHRRKLNRGNGRQHNATVERAFAVNLNLDASRIQTVVTAIDAIDAIVK